MQIICMQWVFSNGLDEKSQEAMIPIIHADYEGSTIVLRSKVNLYFTLHDNRESLLYKLVIKFTKGVENLWPINIHYGIYNVSRV